MNICLLLAGLAITGCAAAPQPAPTGFPFGLESGISAGAGGLPLRFHTEDARARDLHPQLAYHHGEPWLYYASDREGRFAIFRKRLNGRALEHVVAMEGDCLWPRVSPDGNWLAFGSDARGNWDIYVLNMQRGGEAVNLTAISDADEIHPAWAPDGTMLAYAGWTAVESAWLIRTIEFGNAEPVPVTRENPRGRHGPGVARRATLINFTGKSLAGCWPAFSPDGRSLAYQDGPSVRVYTLASGHVTELLPAGMGRVWQPCFSPDGRRIVAACDNGLMIFDLRGDGTQRMGEPLAGFEMPHWARLQGGDRLIGIYGGRIASILAP